MKSPKDGVRPQSRIDQIRTRALNYCSRLLTKWATKASLLKLKKSWNYFSVATTKFLFSLQLKKCWRTTQVEMLSLRQCAMMALPVGVTRACQGRDVGKAVGVMPVGSHSPVGKCVSPKLGRDTRATDGCEKERERWKKCLRQRDKSVSICICVWLHLYMYVDT